MDIFGVLKLIGGLALFLYGMNVMGDGLEKLSGGRLESMLEKMTSTKIKAVLLGALVTAVIQSSSATTVMVVGFVNSGIMQLGKAVGIIMGANVGTTITSWLLSLTGISGDSVFIKLLKPSSFTPVLAAVGIILYMTSKKKDSHKDIGTILLGFAVLMFGMETMSGAVSPLADNASFTHILTMFSNPILGLLAGAVLTAIIQSSSASVGILQALCVTGAVSYGAAIPIIMGQNIGTCVTAIISSIGASKNARRASMIHLYFNILGTAIFMTGFYLVNTFASFDFLKESAGVVGIAIIHTMFNVGCAVVMFPVADKLVKLAEYTIRDNAADEESDDIPDMLKKLDERFLETPAFAMERSRETVNEMAREARECISLALGLLKNYNSDDAEAVARLEQRSDQYEDILGSYLVKLSGKNLSKNDSRMLSIILHCSSDFERITDHALNISEAVAELNRAGKSFTDEAEEELMVLARAVDDIVAHTADVFAENDIQSAMSIEPLEEVIDSLNVGLRQNHINRLREGRCSIEMGIVLEDIITDLERVSDHCSNIAACLIEVSSDDFRTHEYIDMTLKNTDEFRRDFVKFQNMYALPERKEY